jgi:hypothetical protein
MTRVNNRQRGEILPNLVTLVTARERERERERGCSQAATMQKRSLVLYPRSIYQAFRKKQDFLVFFFIPCLPLHCFAVIANVRSSQKLTTGGKYVNNIYTFEKKGRLFFICQQKSEFTFGLQQKKEAFAEKKLVGEKKKISRVRRPPLC